MSKKTRTTATPKRQISRSPTPPSDIPVWLAPAVYGLVTIVLFRDAIFGGATLLGLDNHELGLFARDFYTDFLREFHRFPLWNPLLYGGIPFLDGMHGDIFYPPSLALLFMDARTMWPSKMLVQT